MFYRQFFSGKSIRFLTLITLIFPLSVVQAAPTVEDFAKFADYESVTISPGGTYIAVTHRREDEDVLSVIRLSDMNVMSSSRFGENSGVSGVIWANEERLLVMPTQRFVGQTASLVNTGEIIGIDIDGKNFDLLFSFQKGPTGTRAGAQNAMRATARIIDDVPSDPEHVIIQTSGMGDRGIYNKAYQMNVRNGRLRDLASSPIREGVFVTDNSHNVRFVGGESEEGELRLYHRESSEDEFELVYSGEQLGGMLWPIQETENGEFLVADSVSGPTVGLSSFNPSTGKITEIFRHEVVDVDGNLELPDGRLWAIRYMDHFPRYYYPDENHPYAQLHQRLLATFPQDDVQIVSQTRDLKHAVVFVSGPTNPGEFFIMDTEKANFSHHLVRRPGLKREHLAEQAPIETEVRDGLKVRSYLTMPRGKDKDLPMVVLVHGGPHGPYDSWGFNYETQLLAANGYAVLQVNFRGSGGRGREFEALGYRQWGKTMQDDLTDVVQWVVQQGHANKDRICIYGASYGGYAALTGVFKDPDLYKCAIGFVGVYDLTMMFTKGDVQRRESGENYLERVLGSDMDDLRSRSPAYNAGKIKADVMLVHGRNDQRVPWEHAKKMRAALDDVGKSPEWLLERREGHGFYNVDNRINLYNKMLKFLNEHIG